MKKTKDYAIEVMQLQPTSFPDVERLFRQAQIEAFNAAIDLIIRKNIAGDDLKKLKK